MTNIIQLIFDADDTLWENNRYYDTARENFISLCVHHGINRKVAEQEFITTEHKIVQEKGYGTVNFIAILQILAGQLLPDTAYHEYNKILDNFKEIIYLPRRAFAGVEDTLQNLKQRYELCVLTKGDLSEQETKLKQSGLKNYFTHSFIVSEKDTNTYRSILAEQKWTGSRVCMIGNSPKSDINPALECGMWAIYIPYAHTWYMEAEPLNENHEKFIRIKYFHELDGILMNGNR